MVYYNRRQMLQGAGALGLAAGGLIPSISQFPAMAADTSGYKALICIFMFGGMDGWDTVIPVDAESRPEYDRLRAPLLQAYDSLGVSRQADQLLPLNPISSDAMGGRVFGLPRELQALEQLFVQQNAAIIANVGPLIEPTTRSQIQAGAIRLPRRLFSHNDQQSTWVASAPEGATTGWGGLFSDSVRSANVNAPFTAISTNGNNVFLTGNLGLHYSLRSSRVATVNPISNPASFGARTQEQRALLQTIFEDHFQGRSVQRQNVFERDLLAVSDSAISSATALRAIADDAPISFTTQFPDGGFARQLQTIAEVISFRNELGMSRQVFFTSLGGFDTHSGQVNDLPGRQASIAGGIAAFFSAMQELGIENDVTLFTASDFGRSLTVNGDGTDHGWGGHHFVVGGAVNGGDIYGEMPIAELGHEQDAGNGRLIPTISVEQYAATLGRWFGLNDVELDAALPQLSTFASRDLGFLS